MRLFFYPVLISFILTACAGDGPPPGILSKDRFEDLMWDMIRTGEFLNGYVINRDSVDRFKASAEMYAKVLALHGVSQDQFEKSFSYYRQRPQLMKVIIDSLGKRQETPEELYKPRPDSLARPDSFPGLRADSTAQPDSGRRLLDSIKRKLPLRKKPVPVPVSP